MKKYLLATIAVVCALAFSAFSPKESSNAGKNKMFATAYFHLTTSNISDENDLGKWAYDGASPIGCSGPANVLCSVLAPVDANNQIDASQLRSTIDMRTEPNVSNRQFKP